MSQSPKIFPTKIKTQIKKNKINDNLGTLLIRTIASKNDSNINFPKKDNLSENMVLDLEYSVLIPVKK